MTIASPWRARELARRGIRKQGMRMIGSRAEYWLEPEHTWQQRVKKLPALFRYKRRHHQPMPIREVPWQN